DFTIETVAGGTTKIGTSGNKLAINSGGGNVGIGETSPNAILHISQSVDGSMPIRIRNTFGATSNTNSTVDILSELVGSGLTGQIGSRIRTGKEGDYSSGAARDAYLSFATAENDNLVERMRITSGGIIEVRNGNTVGGEIKLTGGDNDMTINGSRGQIIYEINGAQEYVMDSLQFYPSPDNGNALGTSGNRWTAVYAVNGTIQTSDRNEKTNIISSDLGLDYITKLKPVSYNWKQSDNKKHYGLIAQDVQELGIEFGGLNIENEKYGLNYSEFIAPLVKAIQELSAQVEELKNK
ncbi:MAG: tail fiber domain-containing protein, partial [Dolichospermum sp.]